MDLLDVISHTHALPFRKRPLKQLEDHPAGIVNPVYEIEDFVRDRIVLDPSRSVIYDCENPECPRTDTGHENIPTCLYYCMPRRKTGDKNIPRCMYFCMDCAPDQNVFVCSDCVVLPGQGIEHDPTHRFLLLFPTICAVCQEVTLLEEQPGDIFRGPYREYSASGATLRRVADARACGFCAFVWSALLKYPPDDIQWPPSEDEDVKIRVREPWADWLGIAVVSDKGIEETSFELDGRHYISRKQDFFDMEREFQVGLPMVWSHQMPVNPLTSDKPHCRPSGIARVQKNSGSDEALSLAKMWLDNCRDGHVHCNEPDRSVSPTRLIDLEGDDPARVYLREIGGEASEYAALSYCWGRGDPGLITLKSNFASLRDDGIEIEKLPKTIRETVHAAKKLDLRFLWVDRLCIIQDSPEDWVREAALMCAVYSGAVLTLSADGSDAATKGLFQTDQALSKLDYQNHVGPEGNVTKMVFIKPPHHPTVTSRVEELSQPIHLRGWTMQERLMSRRILHFTSDEMAWECETLSECECRRESRASSRELSTKDIQDMDSIYDKWRLITQDYAKRSFAFESDKLPALQGLAEKFQLLMSKVSGAEQPDAYLAGLWRGDLVAQLAWKPPSEFDRRTFFKATERSMVEDIGDTDTDNIPAFMAIMKERAEHQNWRGLGGYIAPSWSWAHLRGPMSYLTFVPRAPFVSYADVIDARTIPVNASEPTKQVSSGSITLHGHIVRGLTYQSSQCLYEGGKLKDLCRLTKEKGACSWFIQFEPDDSASLSKRWGNYFSDVMLFLLGTKDYDPPEGRGTAYGVSPPMMRYMHRKEEAEDVLEAGFESLDIASSLPEELEGAFTPGHDSSIRWCSLLVLVESQEQRGEFERIGCFDAWGDPEMEAMRTLFFHSVKDKITII